MYRVYWLPDTSLQWRYRDFDTEAKAYSFVRHLQKSYRACECKIQNLLTNQYIYDAGW